MSRSKAIQKIIIVYLTLAILFGAGGCIAVNTPTPQAEVNTPIVTATEIPTQTPAPTITPTPEPRYVVQESAEVFTTAQEIMNQSEEAVTQQARIQRWLDFWVKYDNRPFITEATMHWKYIYDNAQTPKAVWVLLEVGGEYGNKLFTVPTDENGFVDSPPTVAGSTIEAGLGPLEIEANKEGTYLSVENGLPVRINSQGEVVERLIQAQWQAVEKYPIDVEKLYNLPESYEYMVKNLDEFIEAPDGFSDPKALYEWWTEKCVPVLGDQEDLQPNMFGIKGTESYGFDFHAMMNYSKPLLSEPSVFYFRHERKVYPVIILTVETDGSINMGTFAFILHNKSDSGDEGFEAIKSLSEGKQIARVFGQTSNVLGGDQSVEIELFRDSEYNWLDFDGYTWSNLEPGMLWKDRPNKYAIGLGSIGTYDD